MSRPPPFDKAVPVLTLKGGDYVLHHGDLAIARTFGRVGVPRIWHPRGSPRAGRFVALHHWSLPVDDWRVPRAGV